MWLHEEISWGYGAAKVIPVHGTENRARHRSSVFKCLRRRHWDKLHLRTVAKTTGKDSIKLKQSLINAIWRRRCVGSPWHLSAGFGVQAWAVSSRRGPAWAVLVPPPCWRGARKRLMPSNPERYFYTVTELSISSESHWSCQQLCGFTRKSPLCPQGETSRTVATAQTTAVQLTASPAASCLQVWLEHLKCPQAAACTVGWFLLGATSSLSDTREQNSWAALILITNRRWQGGQNERSCVVHLSCGKPKEFGIRWSSEGQALKTNINHRPELS